MCEVFVSDSCQYVIQRNRDVGMYIKPGAFVTHPEHELAIDTKSGRWFARYRQSMLFWYHVDPHRSAADSPNPRLSLFQRALIRLLTLFGRGRSKEDNPQNADPQPVTKQTASKQTASEQTASEQTVSDESQYVVRGPNVYSQLALCILGEDDRLVIKPSHLLGYSSDATLGRRSRWDLLSFLMKQHRYWYIDGPGEVLLCGMGGINAAAVAEQQAIGRGQVVAWMNTLSVGMTSKQGIWAQIAGFNEIGQWTFEGGGVLVTQPSVDVPPNVMPGAGRPLGAADLLTVVSGFGV